MTTAFTARDMLQIVDALGEDGLLRYWGEFFSQLNDGLVCKVDTDNLGLSFRVFVRHCPWGNGNFDVPREDG